MMNMKDLTLQLELKRLEHKIFNYGHPKEFTAWLEREAEKLKSSDLADADPAYRRIEVLSIAEWVLFEIKEQNPDDARTFAERTIRKMHLDRDFFDLVDSVKSIEPGDIDSCRSLDDAVQRFVDNAEKGFPGFGKEKERLLATFRQSVMELMKEPLEKKPARIYRRKKIGGLEPPASKKAVSSR